MPIQGLAHIGVCVSSIERSQAFYADILGFKTVFRYAYEGTPIAFMQVGDCVLELIENAEKRSDGQVDHIALRVADIVEIYTELQKKGVHFEDGGITVCPECFGNGSKWAVFRGPDNERIELNES